MKWYPLVMLLACSTNSGIPGSDIIGTFAMTAEPIERQCELSDVPATSFDFLATVSRDPGTGQAWLTLRGYPRAAEWNGQAVVSEASARRIFNDCGGCETQLEESIRLSLLSESQATAVGSQCPVNPLDGGVPLESEGILPPGHQPGAEALLACGEMSTVIRSANLCPKCEGCSVHYRLKGVRQ